MDAEASVEGDITIQEEFEDDADGDLSCISVNNCTPVKDSSLFSKSEVKQSSSKLDTSNKAFTICVKSSHEQSRSKNYDHISTSMETSNADQLQIQTSNEGLSLSIKGPIERLGKSKPEISHEKYVNRLNKIEKPENTELAQSELEFFKKDAKERKSDEIGFIDVKSTPGKSHIVNVLSMVFSSPDNSQQDLGSVQNDRQSKSSLQTTFYKDTNGNEKVTGVSMDNSTMKSTSRDDEVLARSVMVETEDILEEDTLGDAECLAAVLSQVETKESVFRNKLLKHTNENENKGYLNSHDVNASKSPIFKHKLKLRNQSQLKNVKDSCSMSSLNRLEDEELDLITTSEVPTFDHLQTNTEEDSEKTFVRDNPSSIDKSKISSILKTPSLVKMMQQKKIVRFSPQIASSSSSFQIENSSNSSDNSLLSESSNMIPNKLPALSTEVNIKRNDSLSERSENKPVIKHTNSHSNENVDGLLCMNEDNIENSTSVSKSHVLPESSETSKCSAILKDEIKGKNIDNKDANDSDSDLEMMEACSENAFICYNAHPEKNKSRKKHENHQTLPICANGSSDVVMIKEESFDVQTKEDDLGANASNTCGDFLPLTLGPDSTKSSDLSATKKCGLIESSWLSSDLPAKKKRGILSKPRKFLYPTKGQAKNVSPVATLVSGCNRKEDIIINPVKDDKCMEPIMPHNDNHMGMSFGTYCPQRKRPSSVHMISTESKLRTAFGRGEWTENNAGEDMNNQMNREDGQHLKEQQTLPSLLSLTSSVADQKLLGKYYLYFYSFPLNHVLSLRFDFF